MKVFRWLPFYVGVGLVVLGTLMFWSSPARPEGCLPLEEAELEMVRFEERLFAVGLSSTGFITRIYRNGDKGTWTMFHIRPDGMACSVDDGIALELVVFPEGERT